MRWPSPFPRHRGGGFLAVTLGALVAATVAACAGRAAAHPSDDAPATRALARFLGEDFGSLSRATLETNALPYKVVATALLLAEEERRGTALGRDSLPAVFARFGFLTPDRVAGWPAGRPRPGAARPVGLLAGMVKGPVPGMRIEAATIGCAACHAGVLYDADGAPTRTVWPGLPNTSLDVEGYTQAVYTGLQRADADRGAFRDRLVRLFPETSTRERLTLRHVVQPRVRRRLAELRAAGDRPLPFSNGGAGRTNGVAALTRVLGLYDDGRADAAHALGFTSIPDLAGRGLRSSLLYDGVYAPPGAEPFAPRTLHEATVAHADSLAAVVAFFLVPTTGVTPRVAMDAVPAVRPVVRWLAAEYAPPPFPGRIDHTLAARGAALYTARCASCHGTHADGPPPRRLVTFPNRLVPQERMGTDSLRWAMIDTALAGAIARSPAGAHVAARRTGGYVAPILSGVWATAPYLHNGSVPTLRHLLVPDERPSAFDVGGHRLDHRLVGIAGERAADDSWRYPAGYEPWARPERYDTRRPGLSNRGHERQVAGLSEADVAALLEYLKTL